MTDSLSVSLTYRPTGRQADIYTDTLPYRDTDGHRQIERKTDIETARKIRTDKDRARPIEQYTNIQRKGRRGREIFMFLRLSAGAYERLRGLISTIKGSSKSLRFYPI